MSHLHDTLAPPPDLDVLAARRAELVYRLAAGRGVPKCQAWEAAVSAFSAQHPSWPLPLVEREAARTVGAMVLQQMAAEAEMTRETRRPPLDLLIDLATPETAERMRAASRVMTLGLGAPSIFRGAWKLVPDARPIASRLPLGRLSISEGLRA